MKASEIIKTLQTLSPDTEIGVIASVSISKTESEAVKEDESRR